MTDSLLISISPETVMLLISYGVCALIIFASLIVIAVLKNHTKKQLRPQTVQKSCEKAKKYAETLLAQNKGAAAILGAPNLIRLNAYVSDAAWLAFQIADVKKDILFEGIANTLDGLSTDLSKESENGYLPQEEYEADVKKAVAGLESVLGKLDAIIARR